MSPDRFLNWILATSMTYGVAIFGGMSKWADAGACRAAIAIVAAAAAMG